jgi:hypothetical protein
MPPSPLERARAARANAGKPPISWLESARYGEWLVAEQQVPLSKHTPKVNPLEPPEQVEVDIDHERLLERLTLYGLTARPVEGDGSCQFRAISDQLYGEQDHHALVRSMCIDQLLLTAERYRDYVIAETYDSYVQRMSLPKEWGDHVTLQALSDALGVEINLVTSFESSGLVRVVPQPPEPWQPRPPGGAPLWLSFWAEIHYQSLGFAP